MIVRLTALAVIAIGLPGCLASVTTQPTRAGAGDRLAGLSERLAPGLGTIDRRRFDEAALTALDFGRPGGPVAWRNPDTGSNGEVIAGAPREAGGTVCRELRATIGFGAGGGERRATACRGADGIWRAG